MTFIDAFVAAVPNARRDEYLAHARKSLPLFLKHGATGMMENWGVDVPDGKLTSLPMAVQLQPDESVVFSWVVWPDRETRDAAWQAMQSDPDMAAMGDMPFDAKRMIFGGFETILQA